MVEYLKAVSKLTATAAVIGMAAYLVWHVTAVDSSQRERQQTTLENMVKGLEHIIQQHDNEKKAADDGRVEIIRVLKLVCRQRSNDWLQAEWCDSPEAFERAREAERAYGSSKNRRR